MSTRKVGIKRATENFYAATNRSQADTVYVFPDEQTLLLQLLKQNQSRLSPRFAEEISDSQYTASFILPTSWLAMEDLGRLGKTTGCFICREPTRWECVRCRSVQYCGKGKYLCSPCEWSLMLQKTVNDNIGMIIGPFAVPFLQAPGVLSFLIGSQKTQDWNLPLSTLSTGTTT